MFTGALFTIHKVQYGNNLNVSTHTIDYIYIYTLYIYILYVYTHTQQNIIQPLKKEGNPAICDNMDEPRGHYVK